MFIMRMIFACSEPSTREVMEKRYLDAIVEQVSIYHPRENVECYVLRGFNEVNVRSISCVTLPQPVKP